MIMPGDPEWAESDAVTKGFNAFLKWYEHTDIVIVEVERLIYSETYFYCGKTDFRGLRNGKSVIGDFKTGNSAGYEGEWYQLAAYALAIEEETGDVIEEGLIVHLDKKTGNFVEYHVTLDDDMKGAWKAAVIHYKNLKRVKKAAEEARNGTR
jgi:CRISPR/Cas system-associated exonuclease Cas4 (RecB family)